MFYYINEFDEVVVVGKISTEAFKTLKELGYRIKYIT